MKAKRKTNAATSSPAFVTRADQEFIRIARKPWAESSRWSSNEINGRTEWLKERERKNQSRPSGLPAVVFSNGNTQRKNVRKKD
jgi:hypothetical protein